MMPPMRPYRVVPIPQSTADAVRSTGRSPRYGHPAHAEVATGYGPCRLCLRFFAKGEERRILFTYDPFAESGARPLPGPVFVHEHACERYGEDDGFPSHLAEHPLTLVAYGAGRAQLAEEQLDAGADVPATAERLLERPGVEYLHVRDTAAGCFDCAIVPRT
jgi:hypothetical protein